MRPARSRVRGFLVLGALALPLVGGCPIGDPGIGVSGAIDLGSSASTTGFTTLEIRAFPADQDTWDPSQTIPTDLSPQWAETRPLSAVTDFPTSYDLGGLGTTDTKRWRVVAWLSQDATSLGPGPGDWWGTQTFSFHGCGSFGGYCEDIHHVDVTLDQQVPVP
jgi:hypothetical protein